MRQYIQLGYIMLHHLAGATIQVANLVNFNCQEDGNQEDGNRSETHSLGFLYSYCSQDPPMFGAQWYLFQKKGKRSKYL